MDDNHGQISWMMIMNDVGLETKKIPSILFPTFEGGGGGKVRLGQFPSIWTFFFEGIP